MRFWNHDRTAWSGYRPVGPGDVLEVRPGIVHGSKSTGDEPLVVDIDMVFTPPGPRPEADPMALSVAMDALARDGKLSRRTGYPRMLQFAVIAEATPEAMKLPGIAGLLMPSLAALGRLRGYKSTFPNTTNNPPIHDRDTLIIPRSTWLRAGCHPADRVADTQITGVRKVKGGTGDVNLTTAVSISRLGVLVDLRR